MTAAPETSAPYFRERILGWYAQFGRDFPWRGERDPYRVLVAERMLHRTQSDQVAPIYVTFIEHFPDVRSLASSTPEEVRSLLAPLGLGWRFETFVPMAQAIVRDHDGQVPDNRDDLLSLPGVGPYTAQAVQCFAFQQSVAVVDTNTIRLAGRFLRGAEWAGDDRKRREVRDAVAGLIDPERSAESNYAMLDLAALVCVAGAPRCNVCPLAPGCEWHRLNGSSNGSKLAPVEDPAAAETGAPYSSDQQSGEPSVQTGSVPFRARARLIRLLGEELISNEVVALTELVKNAYDADAHAVTIRLRNVSNPAQTVIEVEDDGTGMSLDTVLHAWMEPAGSRKRQGRHKRRTGLGRLPLGEKGVGRFAVHKLGSHLELASREPGGPEVALTIAWDMFDDDGFLEDLESSWETRVPQAFGEDRHGTLLTIRSLRSEWTRSLVKRVRDGLARLVSPVADARDFSIVIDCPEYPDFAGPVSNRLLESAPYCLTGTVDQDGILRHDVESGESSIDLRLLDPESFGVHNASRPPACGPFRISLQAWDLDAIGSGGRKGVDRATRAALRASSGVSIYRDGFRVMPYGERGNDWLDLNQRRVNNPTLRLSNNQVVGVVEITQSDNPELRDRTSREGLVDTQAYFDLRSLVLAALSILEERRFRDRHPAVLKRTPRSGEENQVQQLLAEIRDSTARESLNGVVGMLEQALRQREEEYQVRQEHLLRLAGIGMAAEKMTDAFSCTLDSAVATIRAVMNQIHVLHPDGTLAQQVTLMRDQYESLEQHLDLMAPIYRPNIRQSEPLDFIETVHDVAGILAYQLRDAGIALRVTREGSLAVHMHRGHLLQTLLCLLDNAIHALKALAQGQTRQIHVHAVGDAVDPRIIIADSGPGVRPDIRELVFDPFFSGRPGQKGLGLHVISDILSDYNATISLLETPTLLSGANFLVRFDRRRVTVRAE